MGDGGYKNPRDVQNTDTAGAAGTFVWKLRRARLTGYNS